MSATSAPRTARKANVAKSLVRFVRLYGDRVYILLSFVLFVLAWHLFVVYVDPPYYILPSPSEVYTSLKAGILISVTSRASYLYHLASTLRGTFYGFAVGSTIGIVLGCLIAEIDVLGKMLLPYVAGLQSLPKIALAPLLVVWFGFGQGSKVAMAALITFFPLVINTIAGLRSVEPERIELMRSLSANRWQVFRMVKFPSAMPFVFAALDMAIVYALLGTIVAEFMGSQKGMGTLIVILGSIADTGGVFACLAILAGTGMILHAVFRFVEKRVVFWGYREEPRTSA
jgi:NitT/TauT family transport system permease protein